MTPNQIATAAKCYQCSDDRSLTLQVVYLLNQILANGGGGGGSTNQLSQGIGAPVAPPANPAVTNAYLDTNSGIVYWWNVGTASWG